MYFIFFNVKRVPKRRWVREKPPFPALHGLAVRSTLTPHKYKF